MKNILRSKIKKWDAGSERRLGAYIGRRKIVRE